MPTCPPFTRESVSILLKQQHPPETNLAYDWYEWVVFLNERCCKVNTFSTAFCWLTDLNRVRILCFICWPKYKLWVHLCSLSLVFYLKCFFAVGCLPKEYNNGVFWMFGYLKFFVLSVTIFLNLLPCIWNTLKKYLRVSI